MSSFKSRPMRYDTTETLITATTCSQVGVSNNPPGCVPFNLTAPATIPRCPEQCAVQGLGGAANRTDGVLPKSAWSPSYWVL